MVLLFIAQFSGIFPIFHFLWFVICWKKLWGWSIDNFLINGIQALQHQWQKVWTARGTMLKNKLHLVTFQERIYVSLWIFQLTIVLSDYWLSGILAYDLCIAVCNGTFDFWVFSSCFSLFWLFWVVRKIFYTESLWQ